VCWVLHLFLRPRTPCFSASPLRLSSPLRRLVSFLTPPALSPPPPTLAPAPSQSQPTAHPHAQLCIFASWNLAPPSPHYSKLASSSPLLGLPHRLTRRACDCSDSLCLPPIQYSRRVRFLSSACRPPRRSPRGSHGKQSWRRLMRRWPPQVAAEQCPSRPSMSTSSPMSTTTTTTISIITTQQTALKSTIPTIHPTPAITPSTALPPPTSQATMAITTNRTKSTHSCSCSKSRRNSTKRPARPSWQSPLWRSLTTSSESAMPKAVSTRHSRPRDAHAQHHLPLTVSERSYTFVKAVGDGSFGQVWLCDWHSPLPPHVRVARMQQGHGARAEWQGKRLVAIKRMKKRWDGGWDECKKHPELEVSPPWHAPQSRGRRRTPKKR
jgi:hypothetical protein